MKRFVIILAFIAGISTSLRAQGQQKNDSSMLTKENSLKISSDTLSTATGPCKLDMSKSASSISTPGKVLDNADKQPSEFIEEKAKVIVIQKKEDN